MPLAEIITIGDELLIGQVVDTNSAWMGRELNRIGIRVKQITSISDDENHIQMALMEASKRAEIILITGGLGPTKDDVTKKSLCKYFNTGMKFDEESFRIITRLFERRGRPVTPVNRLQAESPCNCEVLLNMMAPHPGCGWRTRDASMFRCPECPMR